MFDPVVNEGAAVDEVKHPAAEGLEGRVGGRSPHAGHLVVEEGVVDGVECLTHHHVTLDCLL